MEQTNLVVTPDGKTWDEVTRDVSYIGNGVVRTSTDTTSTSATQIQIFDEWRGGMTNSTSDFTYNKDFAIAYDRVICLVDGQYTIIAQTLRMLTDKQVCITINGINVSLAHGNSTDYTRISNELTINLKRGDYVQTFGGWYPSCAYSKFQIERS